MKNKQTNKKQQQQQKKENEKLVQFSIVVFEVKA